MKLRKHIALLLSATMVLSMAPATVLAAETEPIASFSFDDASLVNDVDDTQSATAIVTGLGNYNKDVVYETGMDGTGHSVRIGDYGFRLNQKDIGTEYTVSFWTKLDGSLAENQVLIFMGYHSPENWMALSGSTNGYKHWGKGGVLSHTTVNAPKITTGEWINLVYCGQDNSVTSYLNGTKLGTFNSNNPLSGANADIYFGANNWDPGAKALIDNVNIYDVALTDEEIKADYDLGAVSVALADLNLGDTSSVKNNLELPKTLSNGAEVTWTTSNDKVVTAAGVVTRPTEGKEAATATLTGTVTLDGTEYKKSFEVTVLPLSTDADLAEALEALAVPTLVYEDIVLPAEGKNGTTVTWETSDAEVLATDGTIGTRPAVGKGNKTVTLTATVKLGDKEAEKTFEVEVMEEFYGYILSYIKGNNDRTGSLHLAHSTDGKNFTALNSNSGILFAHIDTNNGTKNLSTGIRYTSPYIFRKADGTFGFTATQSDRLTSVYMYDSEDLITYTNERLVDTKSSVGNPRTPQVEYDAAISAYRINWKTPAGAQYSSVSADLLTLEPAVAYDYEADTSATGLETVPEGAILGNVLEVTKAEYDKIVKKLGRVSNTGVEELQDIIVKPGEKVRLPKTITAYYSDDSTTEMNVTWNTSGIDFSEPGTYEVTGKIQQEIYENPLIPQRADPHIEYDEDEGLYYFTASYPAYNNVNNGYDRIILRESDTIAGLSEAEEITIWKAPATGTMARHVWAPEIHKIEGEYYVFFAAGNSNAIWNIRPYVLVCQDDENPYDPESWLLPDGTAEVHAATSRQSKYFKNMSLDMTYFEHNGKHYVIWADIIGQSALYMQEIDPYEPWAGTSEDVILLTTPEFGWERDSERVNEGASVIKNNGKIYVAFSGSGTGPEYCIGLLYADEDADLMDVNSWTKVTYPVLTSSDVPGEYGPGHNSFTVDESGNAMFVYHARSEECYRNQCEWGNSDPLYDPCRHARVKRVHWAADGTPVLNMSYEEELKAEYKNVTVKVIVGEEELPYTDVEKGIWYYDAVYYNYYAGTMTGKSDTTFAPDENLARGQFASILYRIEGSPEVAFTPEFADVEEGIWYTSPILWAKSEGIVNGYANGNFGPGDMITREQMAIMMYNYAVSKGYDVSETNDLTAFADAESVSDYALEKVQWAVGAGIISGKENGTLLDPQGKTARAQCAVIMKNFMEKYN